jgi:hypothetical protein
MKRILPIIIQSFVHQTENTKIQNTSIQTEGEAEPSTRDGLG